MPLFNLNQYSKGCLADVFAFASYQAHAISPVCLAVSWIAARRKICFLCAYKIAFLNMLEMLQLVWAS